MDPNDKDYDVVVDTLQKAHDALAAMTAANIKLDMFNIMDQIRLEHMSQLTKAINVWKRYKHK